MKNIFFILCGIIIALISLEILLQTASFVILQAGKIQNKLASKKLQDKKDYIKILCVGESTTFMQYPKQLTDYLNKNINKDFAVIDCGVPGTNVKNIVDRIDEQINYYKPDIVISMMGVNDAVFREQKIYKRYGLKTLSLFILIKKHIENAVADKLYADENNADYSKIVDGHFQTGKEPEELTDTAKKDPNNIKVLESLVCLYRMRQEYKKVEYYADMFFTHNPDTVSIPVLFMLTDTYIQQKKYDLASAMILKTIKNNKLSDEQKNKYFSTLVESYMSFSTITELAKYYNLLIDNKIQTSVLNNLYQYLTEHNVKVKRYDYENAAASKIPDFNTNVIKENHILLAKKLTDKNISYICMSYPTIPAETFKNFFKNTDLKNKIIFVSNENNFKKKLKNTPYYDLFADNFGGTFGHCKDYGNELIAEQVGKIIIDMVN